MPTALITGISGQDGSYLAESLLSKGFEVHGIIRSRAAEDAGADVLAREVVLHELDITDTEALGELIAATEPDEIYSLAALSSVYQSWANPVLAARVNALPVAQILESATDLQERTGRAVRVLQASSAELFGSASPSPKTESSMIQPTSPYGASKAYAHYMIGMYRQRGLFAATCILYNHESPRRPETFVTRKITASAARISRGLQNTLELGTLGSRRDWGWAPDYVDAMELAMRAPEPDDFVIATGVTHSIADFVARAFARVGIDDWQKYVTTSESNTRPLDSMVQVGDAAKATRLLGWSPTYDFETIVDAMVDNDVAIADAART